ncbi:MAG: cupin domain-containing protein [bacterium]
MPVVKKSHIVLEPVVMSGVQGASKANIIGADQGWDNHTMRQFRLEPKGFTPHHQHDWEHINYVTKGGGRLQIGDTKHDLKQGDYAFVPANTMHQFSNPTDEDFEFICIVPNRGAY